MFTMICQHPVNRDKVSNCNRLSLLQPGASLQLQLIACTYTRPPPPNGSTTTSARRFTQHTAKRALAPNFLLVVSKIAFSIILRLLRATAVYSQQTNRCVPNKTMLKCFKNHSSWFRHFGIKGSEWPVVFSPTL